MPTLAQYRQRMIKLDPKVVGQEGGVGRVFTIATLGEKYADVSALKVGSIDSSVYTGKWMVRPSAASQPADRVRLSYNFDGVAGRIAHNDQDYADLTATDEPLELLEYEPFLLDDCIQQALGSTRFKDTETLPLRPDGRYFLDDFSWITDGSNLRIGWQAGRVLSRNRHFEKWNGYQTITAGRLAPDGWTLTGETDATYARTTTARRGKYAITITSGGSLASISQTIDLLETGVDIDSLRGEKVTVVLVGKADAASTLRARIDDGVTTTNTSYHTGGDTWEELSSEHTISSTATSLTLSVRVEGVEVAEVDEAYLVFGTLDDAVRRDVWPVTWETRPVIYQQGHPLLLHSKRGRGHVLLVESERPYATFDADRVIAGTADADEHDAPLDLIAYGALYRLYSNLAETPANRERFFRYRKSYFERRGQHKVDDEPRYGALDKMLPQPAWVGSRVR